MTVEVELLKVLISLAAGMGTVTATTYSWVLLKTRPMTWTLFGITALLWSAAALLWSQRYLMWYVGDITDVYVANVRSLFLILLIGGYALFITGTYRSGPIWNKKK